MNYDFFDILSLLGSLGLFIYGMKIMSEGIQKVAGDKIRSILNSVTSNRVKGVITGFAVTSLIQSSSATTVLIVSFVNAGLLTLSQSIGVIMGANVGTTVTAWLISIFGFKVKIATYALAIIALGFPLMFFKRDLWKNWGQVFVGFALLFMGLALLKNSVPDLNSNPEVLAFLQKYTNMGIPSVLLFVLIGTLMTVVVQSSSAAMALTLVLSNNGWIPFELAVVMVLGENIGTTITANLAAIVGNVHAKRAALSHLVFNLVGVIWILIFLNPVLSLINSYIVSIGLNSPYTHAGSIPIGLSLFHSVFNIANTLIQINFITLIARLVTKIIPTEDNDQFSLKYIKKGFITTPELSLKASEKEIVRFGAFIRKMLKNFSHLIEITKRKKQRKSMQKIYELEEVNDRMEVAISKYLLDISMNSNTSLSNKTVSSLKNLLKLNHGLERISDIIYQMTKMIELKIYDTKHIDQKYINYLSTSFNRMDHQLDFLISNLEGGKHNPVEPLSLEMKKISEWDDYDLTMTSQMRDLLFLCEKLNEHIKDMIHIVGIK